MQTSSIDSSRMKELGSMKVVQLANRPPASPAIMAEMTHITSLKCVTRYPKTSVACSSSRIAVSTLPKEEVTMNHEMRTTSARKATTSARNANSPSNAHGPISGRSISWMPKAPLVTLRQFRNRLKEMMAKPNETSTKMSSLNRLNTTPTAMATRPARSMPTGSAAKKGHPNVGMASVRSCSYAASEVRMATVYAPIPKNPTCPTDSSPVNPTTKFRLTARIAQMAKTVPTDMANPVPCHTMNTTVQPIMNRFAHSSMLPLANRRNSLGERASLSMSATAVVSICTTLLPRQQALGPEREEEDEDHE